MNVVGIFIHNLMERAQRKAFLDTRNCIKARLEMEDENEKLVSAVTFRFFDSFPHIQFYNITRYLFAVELKII